jgi:hypothetical protein
VRAGVVKVMRANRQACDHSIGQFRIVVHKFGYRVERVKQKMRLELHLKRLELRLCEAPFQLRSFQFSFAKAPIIFQRVTNDNEG